MRYPFRRLISKAITLNHPREKEPVTVVAAGAMGAEGLHNSRLLPVLILDAPSRPDIAELIRVHEFSGPGDLNVQWGEGLHKDHVRIILEFIRPVRLIIIIDFPMAQWGLLIDHILLVRGFYIQIGDENTKISDNPMAPKVVCEIPDTGFGPYWEKTLLRYTAKLFRELGYSRADSKRAAVAYIKAWREANKTPESLGEFIGAELRNVGPVERKPPPDADSDVQSS